MSDDSFIREVNDEIRREQAQALWDRFGPALLVLAILVVLGTAAFVGYRYWDETPRQPLGRCLLAGAEACQ